MYLRMMCVEAPAGPLAGASVCVEACEVQEQANPDEEVMRGERIA